MEQPKDAAGAPVHSIVHTPGPWNAPTDIARGRPRCLVLSNRGDEIARVNHHREEFGADARLIAAAPDLLAACRDMIEAMNDYECGVDDPPTPKHREMMLRAMSAVEKATHQVV